MVTAGRATDTASVVGSTRYTVDVPLPLLATQNGDVGEYVTPHAFCSSGSVNCAGWML